jgi:hypothetical protein
VGRAVIGPRAPGGLLLEVVEVVLWTIIGSVQVGLLLFIAGPVSVLIAVLAT